MFSNKRLTISSTVNKDRRVHSVKMLMRARLQVIGKMPNQCLLIGVICQHSIKPHLSFILKFRRPKDGNELCAARIPACEPINRKFFKLCKGLGFPALIQQYAKWWVSYKDVTLNDGLIGCNSPRLLYLREVVGCCCVATFSLTCAYRSDSILDRYRG